MSPDWDNSVFNKGKEEVLLPSHPSDKFPNSPDFLSSIYDPAQIYDTGVNQNEHQFRHSPVNVSYRSIPAFLASSSILLKIILFL